MTMTDSSPPPSPSPLKYIEDEESYMADTETTANDFSNHPTLPPSAIIRSYCYRFPTPPQSPHSPTSPRGTSPQSPTSRRPKHTRKTSRTANTSASTHSRRRSSLSTSIHIRELMEAEYGPPPHPAPTTPLPPVPGAPRIPYTTPAQERSRFSSYELWTKLSLVEKQERDEAKKKKRHSAPPLRTKFSLPLPISQSVDFRRTQSDNAVVNGYYETTQVSGRGRPSIHHPPACRRSSIKALDGQI
jgi:hypothetical protein